jgi:hypothetical protein
MPTVRKIRLLKEIRSSGSEATHPINAEPSTFTRKVPHGNPERLGTRFESPYRAIPPNALPSAISK